MKTIMTPDMWSKLEIILAQCGVNYDITFEDRDGESVMSINIGTIDVAVSMED